MTAHLQHTGDPIGATEAAGWAHEAVVAGPPSPTTLRPGSFVYLWAPSDTPRVDRPVLARVERATTDAIIARDLGSGVRGKYEVGQAYPARLRWTWEPAAPPESPCLTHGALEIIDRSTLDIEERRELLFGAPGSTVRIVNKAGESVTGVPTAIVVDGGTERICWVIVEGPTDARGTISYRVKYEDISTVVHGGGR